jgi:hypothetical protein
MWQKTFPRYVPFRWSLIMIRRRAICNIEIEIANNRTIWLEHYSIHELSPLIHKLICIILMDYKRAWSKYDTNNAPFVTLKYVQ